jgi:hypothetical protein
MFSVSALFALHPVALSSDLRRIMLFLIGLIFALIIGFRYEVGGDWDRYLFVFSYLDSASFFENYRAKDIGYEFLYWVSINYFDGVYFVNMVSALIFISGLIRFCRILPLPWLALLVSTPFLIVVVSMGYTRQASAVGLFMWGLVDLMKGKRMNFYLFTIMGSLFHYTVLAMLPIGIIYNLKKINFFKIVLVASVIFIVTYVIFLKEIEHMVYYYITIKYKHSEGAVIRVLVTFFTAIIFFIYRNEFKKNFHDEKLWFIFSLISIAMLPLAIFYSTFADRIAIYFIPIQLVVLSRVPVIIVSKYYRTLFVLGTVVLYFSILFVWLNFGKHSIHWLPYQNILW